MVTSDQTWRVACWRVACCYKAGYCPPDHIAAGTGIGYGALGPVSELSGGSGTIVALFNPSDSTYFSGSVVLNCVWGLDSDLSTASVFPSKRAAVAASKRAEADVLAAVR